MVLGFLIESGRIMIFKHELQSVADAVALAGASQTRFELIEGYDTETGGEKYYFDVVIDTYNASQEAKSAYIKNKIELEKKWGLDKRFIKVEPYAKSSTLYYASVTGEIDFRVFQKIFGLTNRSIEIKVEAESKVRQH